MQHPSNPYADTPGNPQSFYGPQGQPPQAYKPAMANGPAAGSTGYGAMNGYVNNVPQSQWQQPTLSAVPPSTGAAQLPVTATSAYPQAPNFQRSPRPSQPGLAPTPASSYVTPTQPLPIHPGATQQPGIGQGFPNAPPVPPVGGQQSVDSAPQQQQQQFSNQLAQPTSTTAQQRNTPELTQAWRPPHQNAQSFVPQQVSSAMPPTSQQQAAPAPLIPTPGSSKPQTPVPVAATTAPYHTNSASQHQNTTKEQQQTVPVGSHWSGPNRQPFQYVPPRPTPPSGTPTMASPPSAQNINSVGAWPPQSSATHKLPGPSSVAPATLQTPFNQQPTMMPPQPGFQGAQQQQIAQPRPSLPQIPPFLPPAPVGSAQQQVNNLPPMPNPMGPQGQTLNHGLPGASTQPHLPPRPPLPYGGQPVVQNGYDSGDGGPYRSHVQSPLAGEGGAAPPKYTMSSASIPQPNQQQQQNRGYPPLPGGPPQMPPSLPGQMSGMQLDNSQRFGQAYQQVKAEDSSQKYEPSHQQIKGEDFGENHDKGGSFKEKLTENKVGPKVLRKYFESDHWCISKDPLKRQDRSGLVNLLQERSILPSRMPEPPPIELPNLFAYTGVNAHPDVFSSTMNAIPTSTELLKKSRIPLGLILHPFKDLKQLNVLQASVIVRCKQCRTYINPFVQFPDQRHWKCNICFRINDIPDEFHFDPATKTYGDPQRRPEIKNATVEFIAPTEYMLRPPQPPIYLFCFDVSSHALETGYLPIVTQRLLENLPSIPGDKRTLIGFIAYDASVHFYLFPLREPLATPVEMVVTEVDDIFLPFLESRLLVNLEEYKAGVEQFLANLPKKFPQKRDHLQSKSALGAALKAAYLLMSSQGGRVTVFQTVLPNVGPGSLQNREDPNERASKDVQHLNPATDYYKTLALECAGQQVAVDMFLLTDGYADLASIGCISKYSGGCIYYFPAFHALKNPVELTRLEDILERYLTRKHGFEAVLRIRCTRGLSLHTFHGNAFVRSVDLLALPNVNPDAAFGVQLQMEDNLTESRTVSFQAALLFTSSRGERRIRVHTLCLPVTNSLSELYARVNTQAVVALLARMAVDRSCNGKLEDAREALVNSVVDGLGAFASTLTDGQRVGALVAANSMKLWPLFVLGLLKHPAFSFGTSIRLDERVAAMDDFKTLPLSYTLLQIYPHLYALHTLTEETVDKPELIPLTCERLERHGAYLMDTGSLMLLYLGQGVQDAFLKDVFDVPSLAHVDDDWVQFPELPSNPMNCLIRKLVDKLETRRPFSMPLRIFKEGTPRSVNFMRRLIEDRTESTFSYREFLQCVKKELRAH